MSLSRAHILDVSHWSGRFKLPSNPPRPVDGIIQKLTEAIYLDEFYDQLKADIQSVPIRGGYHYWRPQWSWRDQADKFLDALTQDYHFWALDVEKAMNYSGPKILNRPYPGFAEMLPLIMKYLTKEAGRPGLLYTGAGTWMDWLVPVHKEMLQYDLWVPHYWWKPDPEGIPNYFTIKGATNMRKDWKIWQYDPNAMGGRGREFGMQSLGGDLNVFNGDVDEFRAWAVADIPHPDICPTCKQSWPQE